MPWKRENVPESGKSKTGTRWPGKTSLGGEVNRQCLEEGAGLS